MSKVQTIVQVNIYRSRNNTYEYLLLKQIDGNDDHFWQPVSQAIENEDAIAEALKLAAKQQAGIDNFKLVDQNFYSYDWYAKPKATRPEKQGRNIVFAAEVGAKSLILPDLTRYSSFEWLSFKQALLWLKWDGNKRALRELQDRLESQIQAQAQAQAQTDLNETSLAKILSPAEKASSPNAPTSFGYIPGPASELPRASKTPNQELPLWSQDEDHPRKSSSVFPL